MSKTTTTETNSLGLFLEFLWGVLVLAGTSYLVFFKGISHWWFVPAVLLLGASLSTKKTEYE